MSAMAFLIRIAQLEWHRRYEERRKLTSPNQPTTTTARGQLHTEESSCLNFAPLTFSCQTSATSNHELLPDLPLRLLLPLALPLPFHSSMPKETLPLTRPSIPSRWSRQGSCIKSYNMLCRPRCRNLRGKRHAKNIRPSIVWYGYMWRAWSLATFPLWMGVALEMYW